MQDGGRVSVLPIDVEASHASMVRVVDWFCVTLNEWQAPPK